MVSAYADREKTTHKFRLWVELKKIDELFFIYFVNIHLQNTDTPVNPLVSDWKEKGRILYLEEKIKNCCPIAYSI